MKNMRFKNGIIQAAVLSTFTVCMTVLSFKVVSVKSNFILDEVKRVREIIYQRNVMSK